MYETEDEETNTIIDMMTGYGNKQKVTALMRKYGYYDVFPLEKFARPDKALYETIRGMHMKYGSPYVTFDGFYNFLGFGEEYAALYTPNHRLHINNCDSVKVILQPRGNGQKKRQKDSSSSKTLIAIDDRQSYLHNKRIAELAHAKQMQRDGFIKLSAKVARDATFNKVKGNSYGKLYTTGGTFENEAHSVIAPELCEEFITSYISKVDTNDDHYRKIISSLYNGYFEKYQDKEEAKRWLKN